MLNLRIGNKRLFGNFIQNLSGGLTPVGGLGISLVNAVFAHEPVGLNPVTHNIFNTVLGTGWTAQGGDVGNEWSIIQDSSSPMSPSNVLRCHINANHSPGTGVDNITTPNMAANNYTELFGAFYFKADSNVAGNMFQGVQKLLHIWMYGGNPVNTFTNLAVPVFFLTGGGVYRLQMNLQRCSLNNPLGQAFNIIGPNVQLNEWYLYEYHMVYNTGSNADGICRNWVTRVSTGTVTTFAATNIIYNEGTTKEFVYVDVDPTTPGGTANPGAYDLYFDDVYLSAR